MNCQVKAHLVLRRNCSGVSDRRAQISKAVIPRWRIAVTGRLRIGSNPIASTLNIERLVALLCGEPFLIWGQYFAVDLVGLPTTFNLPADFDVLARRSATNHCRTSSYGVQILSHSRGQMPKIASFDLTQTKTARRLVGPKHARYQAASHLAVNSAVGTCAAGSQRTLRLAWFGRSGPCFF
jgi:hypothetical protein